MLFGISTDDLYICELGKLIGFENNNYIISEERSFIIAKKSFNSHYKYKDIFSKIIYERIEISNNIGDIYIVNIVPIIFYRDYISKNAAFELLNDLNNMNIKRLTKKKS